MCFEPGQLVYWKMIKDVPKGIISRPSRLGMIVRKKYQAFSEKYSRYDVLIFDYGDNGSIITLVSHSLMRAEDANKNEV